MIALLIAVVVASLLGSMHCIGMCGPLALWSSGAGGQQPGHQLWARLLSYHLGRLITYTTAGLLAGTVGAALTAGGSLVGIQSAAARVVGGAMIALALIRLAEFAFPNMMKRPATVGRAPAAGAAAGIAGGGIAGWVARRRPMINRLPLLLRGVAAGSLTTLLPCGWLYLFVLVAAGTGHPVPAVGVMWAFWLGTLPALTALVAGAFRLAPRFGRLLPVMGAALLMVTGLYTATGRAAADLSPLTRRAAAVNGYYTGGDQPADEATVAQQTLDVLKGEPLPCCVDGD